MKKLALFLALCLFVTSIGLAAFADNDEVIAPVEGSEETTPVEGSEETTPVEGSEETTPVEGSEETTPVEGSEETTPVEGSEETTPVEGGEDTTPVEGGEDTTPVEGGEATTPVEGGEDATPVEGGEAITPVEGGEVTTPTEGGEDKSDEEIVTPAAPAEEAAAPTAEPAEEEKNSETHGGDADNFVINSAGVILSYDGQLESVTIPAVIKGITVTRLSEAVFANKAGLKNITISAPIQLDAGAFRNCTGLLSCSMSNIIGSIPAECFENCTSLASVAWPTGISYIGQGAFRNCTALTGVPQQNSITIIDDNAFYGCTGLVNVDFSTNLQWIGQGAFYGCTRLTEVILPDSVTDLGNHAFENCFAVAKLRLSNGLTVINNFAFKGCSSIPEINIPENVAEIGREAFYGCSGASIIRIPDGVRNISFNPTNVSAAAYTTPSKCVQIGNDAFAGRNANSWLRWDTCTAGAYIGTNGLGSQGFVMAPIDSPAHKYCKNNPTVHFCSTGVRDFVERNYQLILGRVSDEAGLLSWCRAVSIGEAGAGLLVQQFMNSQEFQNTKPSNSTIVEILYQVMLGRASDAAGKKAWLEWMDMGLTKDAIINGFNESQEFIGICNFFGIVRGIVPLPHYRDRSPGATAFVARCYTEALNRPQDTDGLEAWTKLLVTKKTTASVVAQGFFFSQEYINRNRNNQQYVHDLYRVYFGRDEDAAGMNAWLTALAQGYSRLVVLSNFAGSAEFEALAKSYGLIAR